MSASNNSYRDGAETVPAIPVENATHAFARQRRFRRPQPRDVRRESVALTGPALEAAEKPLQRLSVAHQPVTGRIPTVARNTLAATVAGPLIDLLVFCDMGDSRAAFGSGGSASGKGSSISGFHAYGARPEIGADPNRALTGIGQKLCSKDETNSRFSSQLHMPGVPYGGDSSKLKRN